MKLLKINDTTFINPALVTSVRIHPSIGDKAIYISLGEDDVRAADRLSDDEAQAQLLRLVDKINEELEDDE